jgi:hypothetical protein
MDIAQTTAFARERLFADDVADAIAIDGVIVSGHKDEQDVDGPQMGVFENKLTLVITPDAIALPVPGQQMVVDDKRVTVTSAVVDAMAMTINAMRNGA